MDASARSNTNAFSRRSVTADPRAGRGLYRGGGSQRHAWVVLERAEATSSEDLPGRPKRRPWRISGRFSGVIWVISAWQRPPAPAMLELMVPVGGWLGTRKSNGRAGYTRSPGYSSSGRSHKVKGNRNLSQVGVCPALVPGLVFKTSGGSCERLLVGSIPMRSRYSIRYRGHESNPRGVSRNILTFSGAERSSRSDVGTPQDRVRVLR